MSQLGLALSGGGFRASLYHLGVIRFLRDAGLLSQVTHITSVSGGSVIGAHLALNWKRYCDGSDEEFEQAAGELLTFLQLDVRNRIVRRFPLASLANFGLRTVRLESRRKLTRAGLLEHHYEKFLYGDQGLFDLPCCPRLYILATNLSEGSICAFYHNGMLLQRRGSDGRSRFDQINLPLATVSMAVAASSAFPGFFPPLVLRSWEVGAREGDFNRHALTDGGIYDNLGLRMFHHLQRSSLPSEAITYEAAKTKPDQSEKPSGESHPRDARSSDTHPEKADGSGVHLDKILVSNAGATFKVRSEARSGGLLSTAMRSSDILMDRVNQLELQSFHKAAGIFFLPITQIVSEKDDPHAPHPAIQRQSALIRTDMDRFSNLEIAALVQHGYSVARLVCRSKMPTLLTDCPEGPAWCPKQVADAPSSEDQDTVTTLSMARELQHSASRRILSTLLNWRDWPTYVWAPLVLMIAFTIPYWLYKSNKTAVQRGYVLSAIAGTSPVYNKILSLIETGPVDNVQPSSYEEVDSIEPSDLSSFECLSDNRIVDLRAWFDPENTERYSPTSYARLLVRRTPEAANATHLRLQTSTIDDRLMMSFQPDSLKPTVLRANTQDGSYQWQVDLDVSNIPADRNAEIFIEGRLVSETVRRYENEGRFQFTIYADTGLTQIWILMPHDRQYKNLEIIGFPMERPEQVERVIPSTTVELPVASIVTFQLIEPKHKYRYECRWRWKD